MYGTGVNKLRGLWHREVTWFCGPAQRKDPASSSAGKAQSWPRRISPSAGLTGKGCRAAENAEVEASADGVATRDSPERLRSSATPSDQASCRSEAAPAAGLAGRRRRSTVCHSKSCRPVRPHEEQDRVGGERSRRRQTLPVAPTERERDQMVRTCPPMSRSRCPPAPPTLLATA